MTRLASSAALLVLLAAGPAAAQDFSTYDGRADFVVDVLAGPDVAGSWGTYTLARLARDPDDAEALEQAVGNVVRLDNQSVPIGTIALALYWDHFSEAQRQTMLDAMKSWREVDGHGTENHALMQNACGYLFTQWFPDETGWTTNSMGPMDSGPLNARIRDNLVRVASSLFDKGYVENLSTTYLLLHLYPWMMIQQFADDEALRNVANAALHFHLANLAVNSFHGQVVSPFNRSNYQQQNTPHVYDLEGSHTQIPQVPFLSWLYWGEGTHFDDPETLGDAIRRFHGHIGFFTAMRAWGPPPEVLRRIGAGEGAPYTVRSSAADFGYWGGGEPHDNMRTVHRTDRYAVGTGFFRYAPGSFYINYNNFGVLYDTEDKHNVVDINQNYWMSDLEEGDRWPHCMNSPFQQDAMHENTVISLFNVPETDPWRGLGRGDWIANRDGHYDGLIQRVDVRYPSTVDEVVERDGWVFLREADVFIAIRPLREYTTDTEALPAFTLLRSPGATNAVVLEVGTAEEHGDFAAFQATVEANPLRVDWDTLTVEYTDSQGDAIRARWVAPDYALSGGGERVLVRPEVWVDGEYASGVPPEEWPLIESPHVRLEGRVLRIEHGRDRLTVDWSGEQPVFFAEELCEEGQTECGGACVDASSDPVHCGGCGVVCEAPANAEARCGAGACGYACADGWSDCNGERADGCEHEGVCASGDASTGPTEPVVGGCGCRVDAGPGGAPAWPLAILALLALRRRGAAR